MFHILFFRLLLSSSAVLIGVLTSFFRPHIKEQKGLYGEVERSYKAICSRVGSDSYCALLLLSDQYGARLNVSTRRRKSLHYRVTFNVDFCYFLYQRLLIIVTTIIIVVSIMIVIMIRNGQKLTYKRNSFDDSATFYIFLNFYVLQHLPIVCLVLYIILFAKHREGPTMCVVPHVCFFQSFTKTISSLCCLFLRRAHGFCAITHRLSKVWLFLAMALNITNDLPLNLWAEVLPSTCSLYICRLVQVKLLLLQEYAYTYVRKRSIIHPILFPLKKVVYLCVA